MRAVHVLFYRPGEDDRWLNHVVSAFDPPFSHCDIQFEDNFASSVYQGEPVYWELKSFSRLNYDRISLAFADHEYDRVRAFCQRAHAQAHRFDGVGMVCSILPVTVRRPEARTFCSRYICEALQASGRPEFLGISPCLMSPSKLHTKLVSEGKGFLHVSEKRMENIERVL